MTGPEATEGRNIGNLDPAFFSRRLARSGSGPLACTEHGRL